MPEIDTKIREIEINMARQDERIGHLAECYNEQGQITREIKEAIDCVKKDIGDLKIFIAEKNAERPSWAVTIAITILTGLVVGLSVYLVQVV